MLQWSKYFQSPEYLDTYRIMILNPELRSLIARWIKLENNMCVLDVGCGTGAFTFYLEKAVNGCQFYGVDIDGLFISKANEVAKAKQTGNTYNFQVADALELPFPDNYFDVVTSYTFLTNVGNGKQAMREMIRVAKKGCTISSITAQSFQYQPYFEGIYPLTHAEYYFEYQKLRTKIEEAYRKVQPLEEYIKYGTAPERIPSLFVDAGLECIRMYPIGWAFSLSNAACGMDEKERYIHLASLAEEKKVKAYSELPSFTQYVSKIEIKRYLELLEMRKIKLMESLGENDIWEWFGGAQILLCGQKV